MTDKQQAKFGRLIGVIETPRGIRAMLQDVCHPVLGQQHQVTTSDVLSMHTNDAGHLRIVTINTEYSNAP